MAKKSEETPDEPKAPKYIAKQEFRDVNNFDIRYDIGEEVSHLDQDTLDRLESLGAVTKE